MVDDPKDPADDPKDDPKDPADPPKKPEDDLGDAGKKAIDAERKARAAAEKRAKELEAKVKEFEDKDKSESEKATEARTKAEKERDEAVREALRLNVAFEKGLTPAQAKRLSGSTKEELEADADELLELFKPDDGKKPPSTRPRERLRGGADPDEDVEETDPAKLAASIPIRY